MKLVNIISPYITQILTSDTALQLRRLYFETRRKLQKRPHVVTFYFRANDPYSFLLAQKLKRFKKDFNIELECRVIQNLPSKTTPEPELLERHSLKDGKLLADLWQLDFPTIKATPSKVAQFTFNQILSAQKNSDDFLNAALEAGHYFWHNNFDALRNARDKLGSEDKEACEATLKNNQNLLAKQGHYLSGMLYYQGEWYWGLDRLNHLASRLQQQGLAHDDVILSHYFNPSHPGPLQLTDQSVNELDFYFSFRSPYSYLAVQRTIQLCKQYNIKLNIKPVMPMVMRGLPVPAIKRLYIVQDAAREAALYGIPFGKICDPVGKGVERCLAVFEYAKLENKSQQFILSASQGIWSEGLDPASDNDLEKIVRRSTLDWQLAKPYLNQTQWRDRAEKNHQALLQLGLWGVPTFKFAGLNLWGQDRIWVIKSILEKKHRPMPASDSEFDQAS